MEAARLTAVIEAQISKAQADIRATGAEALATAGHLGTLGKTSDSMSRDIIGGFSELGAAFNALTGNAIPNLIDRFRQMADTTGGFLTTTLPGLLLRIPGVAGAMTLLGRATDAVKNKALELAATLASAVQSRFTALVAKLHEARDAAVQLADRGLTALLTRFPIISDVAGKARDGLERVSDTARRLASGAMERLNAAFPHLQAAGEHFGGALSILKERIGAVGEAAERAAGRLKPLKDAAERVGSGFLHAGGTMLKFGGIAAGIGLAAVAGGIALAADKLGEFVKAGEQANATAAQTAAVLKSTHGAAGVTADSVEKLSTQLMNLTGIDDDTVTSAQNILLTFTGIHKDVFPQVTKTALDMATALHTNANDAAMQLGKSLNDLDYQRLIRDGVTFTDSQKKQLDQMKKAGDVAGGQKIILAELNREFGGSAEAAGKANGGIKILTAQFDNMKQTVGQAIIPILGQLFAAISPLISQLAANLPGAIDTASKFFTANILPVLKQFGGFIISDVVPAVLRFASFIQTNVVPALINLFHWAQNNVLPVIKTLATVFVNNILPALGNVWNSIQQNLIPALERLWEKIEPAVQTVLPLLGGVLQNVVGPAIGGIIDLVSKLIDLISGLVDKIGGALGKLGDFKDLLGNGLGAVGNALGLGGHAAGTNYHAGGPFIGAEQGPELLLTPGIYSAPRGSTILNARDTAAVMGGNGGSHTTVNIYPQKADLNAADLSRHLRRAALHASTGGAY